jgi:hypothetical protein
MVTGSRVVRQQNFIVDSVIPEKESNGPFFGHWKRKKAPPKAMPFSQ